MHEWTNLSTWLIVLVKGIFDEGLDDTKQANQNSALKMNDDEFQKN